MAQARGEFENGKPMLFAVLGNRPDPATITKESGVVKYELIYGPGSGSVVQNTQVKGVVLFQVLDGEKLKVEVFPGKKGSQVSGFISPVIYER